jgi:hypothetical protein
VPLQVIGVRVGVSLLGWMVLAGLIGAGLVVNARLARVLLGLPTTAAVVLAVVAVALQLVVGVAAFRRASWWLIKVWLRMR